MNVLVVVAHPDDEALGCGGTIAKLSAAGSRVTVLLPTRRCDERGRKHWDALIDAFHDSCGILGAEARVLDTLMDERQAELQLAELHDRILPYVKECDEILTHWPGDVNQVHRGISRAVEIATRPFRRRRNVRCFEVPTSTDQGFGGIAAGFHPTEYVLLDAPHAARKREAVARYVTEMAPGRTEEDVERKLRSRGAEVGHEFAEAFVVARQYR